MHLQLYRKRIFKAAPLANRGWHHRVATCKRAAGTVMERIVMDHKRHAEATNKPQKYFCSFCQIYVALKVSSCPMADVKEL